MFGVRTVSSYIHQLWSLKQKFSLSIGLECKLTHTSFNGILIVNSLV